MACRAKKEPIVHELRVLSTVDVLVKGLTFSLNEFEGFWESEGIHDRADLVAGFTVSREDLGIACAVEDGENAALEYPEVLEFMRSVRDELPEADEYFFHCKKGGPAH